MSDKTLRQHIEDIIDDIEIDEAWNSGIGGSAAGLNKLSVDRAVNEIMAIIEERKPVKVRAVVDRSMEHNEVDPCVLVTFPDGREVSFWLVGLSDEECVKRAEWVRDHVPEEVEEIET